MYKNGDYIGVIKKSEIMEVPVENPTTTFLFKAAKGKFKLEGQIKKNVDTHIFLWSNRFWGGIFAEKSGETNALQVEKEKDMKARSATQKSFILLIPGINLLAIIVSLPFLIKNWPYRKKFF